MAMRADRSHFWKSVFATIIAVAAVGLAPEPGWAQNLSTDSPITSLRNVLGPGAKRNSFRRLQYHYEQRAYPYERVPAGALQSARQYYSQSWGAKDGKSAPAFSSVSWT